MILIIGFSMEITANGTHQHFNEIKGGLTIVGSGNSFSLQNCDLVMNLSGTYNILTIKNSSLQLWLNGKKNMLDCESCQIEMLIHGIQNQVLSTESNVQVFDIRGDGNHVTDKSSLNNYEATVHRISNRNRSSGYLSNARQYQMPRPMNNHSSMIGGFNPQYIPASNIQPYNYQQPYSYSFSSSQMGMLPFFPMSSHILASRSNPRVDLIQEQVQEPPSLWNRFSQFNRTLLRNRQDRSQRYRPQQRYGLQYRFRDHQSLSENSIEREEEFRDDESSESDQPGNMFSEQEIDQLLVSEYKGKQKQCMICLDQILQNDKVIFLTCSHSFHVDCCKNWLRKSSKCPLCQIDLHKSMDYSKFITIMK